MVGQDLHVPSNRSEQGGKYRAFHQPEWMVGDGYDGSSFGNQREIASGNQRMNVERGQSALQHWPVPIGISQAVKKALEAIQNQEPFQRAFDRRGQFRTE